MRRFAIVLASCAALGVSSSARAAWAPDGNPVARLAADEYGIRAIPYGGGGVLVAWLEDYRAVRLSALTADGDLASGWPAGVLPLTSSAPFLSRLWIAADHEGGAFVSWDEMSGSTRSVHLQRVTGAGTIAPGWPDGGIVVAVDGVEYVSHPPVSDEAGGAYLYWVRREGPRDRSMRLVRITGAGTRALGWPEEGLAIGPGFAGALAPDGAGGVFAGGVSGERPHIWVQRVTADGATHADWPADGAVISDEGAIEFDLVPDQAGGVFVSWIPSLACIPEGPCHIPRRASRLDGSGGRRPGCRPVGSISARTGRCLPMAQAG